MKELSYDKWLELTADERVEDDAYWSTTGPKRKVPVLCDENLESDFVEALRGVRSLKLYRLPNGRGDRTLWDHARSHGLMLFTADGA